MNVIKRIKEFTKDFLCLINQLFSRSNEELAQELESLYAEREDLLKQQTLLDELLAEVKKKQGENK